MPEFFDITKMFHNQLQGSDGIISNEQKQIYIEEVKKNAREITKNYDYVIIHDPQALAILDNIVEPTGKWIWRCHIDTLILILIPWNFLYPYMKNYDAVIFTLEEFVKEGADLKNLTFIPPSIDPLSPKNTEMSKDDITKLMDCYNIDTERPLLVQVSRFDPGKILLE